MFSSANESTRRALRTLLQGVAAVATFIVAVAIPPVGDAVNAILDTIGVNLEVTPGLVAAVGAIGAALTTLVSKLQNLYEGRDEVTSPEKLAAEVVVLSGMIQVLTNAGREAGVEVEKVLTDAGYKAIRATDP